jgi:hypothetical protein
MARTPHAAATEALDLARFTARLEERSLAPACTSRLGRLAA